MTKNDKVRRGTPDSFGWLRRPELDSKTRNVEAWERPDGKIIHLRPNSLVIRGPGLGGIISRFRSKE